MSSDTYRYRGVPYTFECESDVSVLLCAYATCKEVVHNAVELPCCHVLVCESCLDTASRRCPVCRLGVDEKVGQSWYVQNMVVRKLVVACPRGCGQCISLADAVDDGSSHYVKDCAKAGTPCMFGCGVPVPNESSARERHQNMTCAAVQGALRTRSGRTKPGDGWTVYDLEKTIIGYKAGFTSIMIDVDTRSAKLNPGPGVHYIVSVQGDCSHFLLLGSGSVYPIPGVPFHEGFRMYLASSLLDLTPQLAKKFNYCVSWIANDATDVYSPTYKVVNPVPATTTASVMMTPTAATASASDAIASDATASASDATPSAT